MDIPKDPENVAWFNLGQHPGMEGTAVIAGHYGWKEEKVVAFDRLNELQKGDKIYVEDDSGVTTTFVVRETRSYSPSDDATEVFSSNDGISHLNLITCQGIWNKVTKNYSKRLVVFADRE
jgi:LPXTG-site transpeptidase (sortase) family protein